MSTQRKLQTLASQQLHADRLIVASNRGPVEYYLSQDNELKHRRGTGGMVTALIETGNRMKVTWVAMAMTEGDRLTLNAARRNRELLSFLIHNIFFSFSKHASQNRILIPLTRMIFTYW